MAGGHQRTLDPEDQSGDISFDSLPGTARIHRLLTDEMGVEVADAYERTRALQERWVRARHPGEGLRERKKRLTRQQISDVATTLFIVRGFERVTVAQIAEIVGVSEKTIYNYFPTKESLVFDEVDEGAERLAGALRERQGNESPTRVILREFAEQHRFLEQLPRESHRMLPLFAEMVESTSALRAAWLEVQDRLTAVVTAELARHAEIDPLEPEPAIAARAITGLVEVSFQSRIRHVEAGLSGRPLADAIDGDLERAARLLDTGLWSFNLLTHGARSRSQLKEAALATEQARKQVLDALKQARSAWQELRGQSREEARAQRDEVRRTVRAQRARAGQEGRHARQGARGAAKTPLAAVHEEAKRAAKTQALVAREEVKRVAREQAAAIRDEAKRAAKEQIAAARAERRAERHGESYEEFRRAMAARHEAIRNRTPWPGPEGRQTPG